MATAAPLDSDQTLLWRSLMRVLTRLPRALDSDLLPATGLSLTEYTVLMNLSDAKNHELRMADLAAATALSASRITRLVDGLQSRNLVAKRRAGEDGRGNIATLTADGLARLKAAYSDHLDSAHRRVVDHVDAAHTKNLAALLTRIADELGPDAARSAATDTWH
jgi:DNA-binding MarR family transcriptional regulator